MRRIERAHLELEPGEIGDAEHADVAVAPGLVRQPLDRIAHVLHFQRPHHLKFALRLAGAAHVDDGLDVTAPDQKRRIPRFDVAPQIAVTDRPQRRGLDLAVIRVATEDHRKLSCASGAKQVSGQQGSVPDGNPHVTLDDHFILALGCFPLLREHSFAPPIYSHLPGSPTSRGLPDPLPPHSIRLYFSSSRSLFTVEVSTLKKLFTIFSNSSPATGSSSKFPFLASATNSASFNVAWKAFRKICTRSFGVPGGNE